MGYTFKNTRDPIELQAVYGLPALEWSGSLSAQEFAQTQVKRQQKFSSGKYTRAFYATDDTGMVVASTVVMDLPAVNGRALLISYVFTHPDHRKGGLALQMIRYAIAETEKAVEEDRKDRHDSTDNFVWALYLAVGQYYARFGFEAHPIKYYSVKTAMAAPKNVRWLNLRNEKDAAIISRAWQDKITAVKEDSKKVDKSFGLVVDKDLEAPYLWTENLVGSKKPPSMQDAFEIKGAVVKARDGRVHYALWNGIMLDTMLMVHSGTWEKDVEEFSGLEECEDVVGSLVSAYSLVIGRRLPNSEWCYIAGPDVSFSHEQLVGTEGVMESDKPSVLPMLRGFGGGGGYEWVQNGLWSFE